MLSFHDGVSTNPDGSPFYDVRLFRNKKRLQESIRNLEAEGYKERFSL